MNTLPTSLHTLIAGVHPDISRRVFSPHVPMNEFSFHPTPRFHVFPAQLFPRGEYIILCRTRPWGQYSCYPGNYPFIANNFSFHEILEFRTLYSYRDRGIQI